MAATRDSIPDAAPDIPDNTSDLRRMVYAESEISAYNHIAPSRYISYIILRCRRCSCTTYHYISFSHNSDNFKFNSRRSESNDTHSSFPTSNYSESDSIVPKKPQQQTQNTSTRFVLKEQLPSHTKMDSTFSNFSTSSVQTIDAHSRMKSAAFAKLVPEQNFNTSALAAKIRIRESVEMDPFASIQSNGSIRPSYPSARLSEIENKSVITLRMPAITGNPQVRLKLYLPLSGSIHDSRPPQIIALFVNKGADMLSVRMFVEDNYPHKVLKGKIKQICIADEDGEMDDDYPPINDNRDITSLGVQDFWIDRIFDNIETPSIIYSEKEKEYKRSEHESMYDYSSMDDNRRQPCCWWCCGKRQKVEFAKVEEEEKEKEKEYRLKLSDYQQIVDDNYKNSTDNNAYQPPNIDNSESNVQFANV
eukprot:1025988_1